MIKMIKEHSVVVLKEAKDTIEGHLSAGSRGTIVHIYDDGKAFEVEFTNPIPCVVTLWRESIEPISPKSTKNTRRFVKAKPGELKAGWGRPDKHTEPSICYAWGGAGSSSPDGRILCRAFEDLPIFDDISLVKELEKRGYDLTTLKFSIRMNVNDENN